MYYRLKPGIKLRGWKFLPYAIVDGVRGEAAFISRAMFDAAELCNGLVDFDLPVFPEAVRDGLDRLVEAGVVEECKNGETIGEDQRYVLYDNRYMKGVQWSVTGRCNCKCRHCYMSGAEDRYGELSHEDVMKIIDDMGKCGVLQCMITGGEPLVRSDFWEIIDALKERGIVIRQIYSNGLAVDEGLLDGLAERNLFPEFNMSFDGVGHHDWLRGVEGAEKKVRRAFELCREYGFPTGSEMCIWKDNKHVLRDSINYLASVGCGSVKAVPVTNVGAWLENGYNEEHGITNDELYQVYYDYLDDFYHDLPHISIQLGAFFSADGRDPDHYDLPGVHPFSDPERVCLCVHARNYMYISPEGRASTCMCISNDEEFTRYFPFVQEIGMQECLTDSKYMELLNIRASEVLAHNQKCAACRYKNYCLGGCRAGAALYHTNDILGVDESICKMFVDGWVSKLFDKIKQLRPSARCQQRKFFDEIEK